MLVPLKKKLMLILMKDEGLAVNLNCTDLDENMSECWDWNQTWWDWSQSNAVAVSLNVYYTMEVHRLRNLMSFPLKMMQIFEHW